MNRSNMALTLLALVALVVSTTACNKPSKKLCEKAIDNVRRIAGTETDDFGTRRSDMIRSCRGNANKKSVECIAAAKDAQELEKCEGGIFGKLFGSDAGAGAAPTPTPAPKQPADKAKPAGDTAGDKDGGAAPAGDKPTDDKAGDKAAADKPAGDKAAADKAAADKPAGDKAAADKPAGDKAAADKPAGDKPAPKKPADKPAAK